MKKVIYEKETKWKIIIPEVPAVREQIEVETPKTIWVCDFCGRKSGYSMSKCLGCGKDACESCHDYGRGVFESCTFEVGTAEECWDNGFDPASDDYRSESFYLCKSCIANPPEKIKTLMSRIKGLEDLEKVRYDIKNVILDELERLGNNAISSG